MSTQLAVKQTNALAEPMPQQQDAIIRSDMIVPYIIIGQAPSDAVVDRKVQLGDIYRSTNLEKVGGPDAPIEVIFLHNPKTNWIIEEKPKGAQRFEYRRTEPRTALNETLPWSFWTDETGVQEEKQFPGATEWRRVKQFSVFAILPKDIENFENEMKKMEAGEMPDVSKALTPVVFSFRSTSYYAGREIATFYTQASSMRAKMHYYKIPLSCKLEKNDQGTYYVWTVDRTKAKAIPVSQRELVDSWASLINSGTAKIVVDDAAEGQQTFEAPKEKPVSEERKAEVC